MDNITENPTDSDTYTVLEHQSGGTEVWAFAYVDKRGYYVVCPICGLECRGVDESQQTDEDAVTKGADAVYAAHYEKEHHQS